MAESAVSTVLGSVGNLAVQETKFLCGVTLEVTFLKDELMRLQGYLRDAESKRRSGNIGVAILVSQIRDAAYEAENVIELADYMEKRNRLKKGFMGAISRYARLPSDLITFHKIGVEIQRVRRKLGEIFQSAERLKIIDQYLGSSSHVVDESLEDYDIMHENFKDDVVMVGFEDEYKEIVDKLVHEEKMLSAVSIVAMGGAGKTTLAQKVYTSSPVKQYFEVRAWVTVSQKFKVIDLLKEILKQIRSGRDESGINEMNEYKVGKKIHDILLQKRYLVVLDDVWEADTWEQINKRVKAFPDATNGSRLLLTTRKEDVANHVEMPTHVHVLKFLDEDKSWELFSSKALPSYKRSRIHDLHEFEKIGRKLARKCDGLPLALAVLGGYLSKNLNTKKWTNVLLGWPSTKDTQMMRGIIARSYEDLPDHYLRSCLLYTAVFPEDFIIPMDELIGLWIAESFIPHARKHTAEETARKYVSELAQKSLIQVFEHREPRQVWRQVWPYKAIKIHDIIRDWCIEEATQEGFLDVIDETTGQVGAVASDTLISYRSSFQNLRGRILQATPNLRTLFGFGLSSVSFPELRFIRVLQVDGLNLKDFSKVIGRCVHLRYLGLTECEDVTLPSSIGKLLPYLQTIDTRNTYLKSGAPSSLWDIPTLRYAYINNEISLPRSAQIPQNLRELHMVAVDGEIKKDPMPILEKLPCLVVLTLYNWENKTMYCSAQGFPRLQRLQLYLPFIEKWRMEVGTMPNLSHLTLSGCQFIGGIPEGLSHLLSLGFLFLSDMNKDYSDDITVTELKQKGCEVRIE